MKRVSSRQRLVSWDAFDGANVDYNYYPDEDSSDYESTPHLSSSTGGGGGVSVITTPDDIEFSSKDAVTTTHNKDECYGVVIKSCSSNSLSSLKRKRGPSLSLSSQRVSAFPWGLKSSSKDDDEQEEEEQSMSWSLLPPEVQLSVLSFLDSSDVILNVMQSSKQLRELLTLSDSEWLWKDHCQAVWRQSSAPPATSVAVVLPKAEYTVSIPSWTLEQQQDDKDKESTTTDESVVSRSVKAKVKYHELLPLAPNAFPRMIETSLLTPCRWSRSLHRYRPRGPTELIPVLTNTGKHAIQFTGTV